MTTCTRLIIMNTQAGGICVLVLVACLFSSGTTAVLFMYQRRGARRPSKRTAPCQQISVSHSCVSRLVQQNGRPLIGNKHSTMVDNTASLQITAFRATKCLSRAWPVVRSLLTIATVVLLKAAVSVYVFRCPCKNTSDTGLTIFSKLPSNTVYSALFIGVPPFLLWIYGRY